MRGHKTGYDMFSSEFLEKTLDDVIDILDKSNLGSAGDIRMSTFIKEIDRVVGLKKEEDE